MFTSTPSPYHSFHVFVFLIISITSCSLLAAAQPTTSADLAALELAEAEANAAAALAAAYQAAAAASLAAARVRVAKERLGAGLPSEASAETSLPRVHTVPLEKQLVPVMKNGRVVANKTAFFGKVRAGTPPQDFTVVMDTGSGHLILPSTACGSDTCKMHNRYNRTASDSAIDIEADGRRIYSNASERDQVAIAFGTGEVLGEFVEENVCMGGDSRQCVKMRVVVATAMTPDPFGSFAFDGVLGIGLDALALNSKFSFFGEMTSQHPTMDPYFAVYLARGEEEGSSISFGGFDPSLASSEIQWAPVDLQELGYWTVKLKSVRVGHTDLDICSNGRCRAILDTGTSLLGVPREATRQLSRQLARPAPEGPGGSCLETVGPLLTFDLGSTVVSLGVEDYSQSASMNLTVPGKEPRAICKSLLMPVDAQSHLGSHVFIWGEPVLRKYYTIYDLARKRVGFSLARRGVTI